MHFAENCLKFIKLISSAWISLNLIWPNPLTVFQRRFQRFVHNHGYASSTPLRTFSCRFLDRGCFARQGWYFSSAPLQLLATQSCLVNQAEELNGIEFFRTRGPHVDALWALCNSRCSKTLLFCKPSIAWATFRFHFSDLLKSFSTFLTLYLN